MYVPCIKPVPVIFHDCFVYFSSPGAINERVYVSEIKKSLKRLLVFVVNVLSMFKVVLPSLFVNKVSISPIDVIEVTTKPTYHYTNPVSKHAFMCKSVFSTSNVNISPVLMVLTYHVFEAPLSANLSYHVSKVSLLISLYANVTTATTSHTLTEKVPPLNQQLMTVQEIQLLITIIMRL